jgi:very-short-patch-repair endonuclease
LLLKFLPITIFFDTQKKFTDCTSKRGKYCKKLPFDFYLPTFNSCIEYDGRQHFEPVYGQENLEAQKVRDRLKDEYCKENGIKLIRIPYTIKMSEIESYLLQQLG